MPNSKYQIFISSTYQDLKDEREQVIKACLEMGHIPVGMEMFSAADEEQWKIITRQIDESDYYVVIIAQRYGSLVEGLSYTEKEYDYAVQQCIPALGFIINESAPWPNNRIESGEKSRIKLRAFKEKVRQKPVDFWSSKEDLHSKCAIALMKSFNTRPRPGWIRAIDIPGPEVAAEISRLSSENAHLREELAELRKAPDTSHLAQGEDQIVLHVVKQYSESKEVEVVTSWNTLFLIIAKAIIASPAETAITEAIIFMFSSELGITERYQTDSFLIKENDIETVKTQFMALGLITIDYVTSTYEYHATGLGKTMGTAVLPIWKLTSQGDRLFTSLAARRRE